MYDTMLPSLESSWNWFNIQLVTNLNQLFLSEADVEMDSLPSLEVNFFRSYYFAHIFENI